MTISFKPGDIVTVDFAGVTGIKRRPAVMVSSDAYHRARPNCILGAVTSQTSAASATTDYVLQDWRAAGLRLPSAFRSFFITVPRASVIARVGALSDADWQAVRERLGITFDIP